ncbi:hypothetical protein LINPERPRIM_LOCUS2584 [Linum perenne]
MKSFLFWTQNLLFEPLYSPVICITRGRK